MMIDFALEAERERRLPPEKSIYQACLLRFRPIMMTTMAALLGALPLALATAPARELRRPLGISIVGGLLLSQFLTLYTTPVSTFISIASAAGRSRRQTQSAAELAPARTAASGKPAPVRERESRADGDA